MKSGDVYQYKDIFIDDVKTSNHIIFTVINNIVICTDEIYFDSIINKDDKEIFNLILRKIPLDKFKEWYPTFLYNKFD